MFYALIFYLALLKVINSFVFLIFENLQQCTDPKYVLKQNILL
jgi:hypothetical protein